MRTSVPKLFDKIWQDSIGTKIKRATEGTFRHRTAFWHTTFKADTCDGKFSQFFSGLPAWSILDMEGQPNGDGLTANLLGSQTKAIPVKCKRNDACHAYKTSCAGSGLIAKSKLQTRHANSVRKACQTQVWSGIVIMIAHSKYSRRKTLFDSARLTTSRSLDTHVLWVYSCSYPYLPLEHS